MDYLFWIIIGYLSGSILYAYWLPRLFFHMDIRMLGEDHNPGTYNVFQQCGAPMGITVLILELSKASLPIHMAVSRLDVDQWLFALVLASPAFGHAFPIWHHFKGGKSIAASFGALMGLFPVWLPVLMLAVCYLIFSFVIVIEPHLMRSIATFVLWEAGCWRMLGNSPLNLGCCVIALLVIWKHAGSYQGEKLKMELLHQKLHWKKNK